jgi:two-component system, cell cycle sensor histidine kinase and response regulator CckA
MRTARAARPTVAGLSGNSAIESTATISANPKPEPRDFPDDESLRGSTEMKTILILDDEKSVRDVAYLVLKRAGFEVLSTATAEEAVRVAATHAGYIDLFITNHRLADGSSGRDVAEQIRATRPELPVLHISGYPERHLKAEDSITPGGFYLAKPFSPPALVAKVTEILGAG